MEALHTYTLPQLLLKNYRRYGNRKVAMRRKTSGIWKSYTWEDYYAQVKYICLALLSYGVGHGGKVAVLGDNAPEIYWVELAVQATGGVSVGLFPDSSVEEVKYILGHSDSEIVIAEDQEQIDKILQIADGLPLVRKIIYWDPKGLRSYHYPLLASLCRVIEDGRKYEETTPGLYEQLVDNGNGDDEACIFYTSGTTGLPKGVMHTHSSLLGTTLPWFEFDRFQSNFDYLSMLPAAWLSEVYMGLVAQLVSGMCVNFPEGRETIQENVREIAPHVAGYGIRQLEGIVAIVGLKISEAALPKRLAYSLFVPVGYKMVEIRLTKHKVPVFWKLLHSIGDVLVFRPIRDRFGLSKIKWVYTGGTLVNPRVVKFFQAIGVNVKPTYGLSEIGVCIYHSDKSMNLHSSGIPGLGVEARISQNGEILLNAKGMFKGYYKDIERSKEKVVGGWLHTGDGGYIDEDGNIVVLDRLEEMLEVAGGERFGPQFIEVNLRFSPYIKDVIVVGGKGRPYVSALIDIDYNNVGKWADDRKIGYTTFADLSQKAEVYALVLNEVKAANRLLTSETRVKKFCLLHKELDADEAELTRTRKLKRAAVECKYEYIIKATYENQEQVTAQTEVKYRDGRKGKVTVPVKIMSVTTDGFESG